MALAWFRRITGKLNPALHSELHRCRLSQVARQGGAAGRGKAPVEMYSVIGLVLLQNLTSLLQVTLQSRKVTGTYTHY